MNVQLPDGTMLEDIPEGTTKAQIAEKLKANGRDVPAEWFAPPAPQGPPSLITRAMGAAAGPVAQLMTGGMMGASNTAMEATDRAAYESGGKVTDVATRMGASPEVAAGVGTAANVAMQALPMIAGGEAAKALAPASIAGAKKLMSSALKPTLPDLKTGKAARAIDTMLDEGVNATKGGVEKLRATISDLNSQVQEIIKNSTERIDKTAAARAVGETLNKFKYQATPAADKAAMLKTWNEFKNTWFGGGDISIQNAQKIKQGTQRTVEKAYGALSDAETEAQKAIARGLRQSISEAEPAVAGLNKRESDLINALNVTERRALMDANKNPMGLASLAHGPGGWAAFMADKSALFKSLVARMLNAGSEQIPANAARVGIGTYGAARNGPEHRADGGPVVPGKPYVVGERGPEVIYPTAPGMVAPNLGDSRGLWARDQLSQQEMRRLGPAYNLREAAMEEQDYLRRLAAIAGILNRGLR